MSDNQSKDEGRTQRSANGVEVAPPESGEEESGGGLLAGIWEIIRTWGPAFLAVLVVRSMLIEPFRIPSGSMVPTLAIGDNIVVTKFSYGFRVPLTRIPILGLSLPERGDVVVFVFPGEDKGVKHWVDLPVPPFATIDYVKRVVGIPGDTVELRDNILYVNSVPQGREYIDEFTFVDDDCRESVEKHYVETFGERPHEILYTRQYGRGAGDFGPITVPEGNVFVMGDNRDHSFDSRGWGFVPIRNIKGKAQFIWLSWDACSSKLPFVGDFRGERVGQSIP